MLQPEHFFQLRETIHQPSSQAPKEKGAKRAFAEMVVMVDATALPHHLLP